MVEQLIKLASRDRAGIADLCRTLMAGSVIVIGQWADAGQTQLRIQDFRLQGRSFIPIFSDDGQFWEQMHATPFVNQGLSIDCPSLIRILRGDELLILNPGSGLAVQLDPDDFLQILPGQA